jgi:hypothetical protein
MASCTTDEKVFITRTVYSSGSSGTAVGTEYRREFVVRAAPSRDIIYYSIKQSEETESVCDKCAK